MKTYTITKVPAKFIVEEWDSEKETHAVIGFADTQYKASQDVSAVMPTTKKKLADTQIVELDWSERLIQVLSDVAEGKMLEVICGERIE